MYIHEAVRAANDKAKRKPFIRRLSWPNTTSPCKGYKIRITDAPSGCIAYSFDLPPEKWVPRAEDLAADDWEPCL